MFVLALAVGPAVGLMGAWLAEVAQVHVDRSLFLSVVIGVVIGLILVGLVRFAQVGHRPTILMAVALAAAAASMYPWYASAANDFWTWPDWLANAVAILASAVTVTLPALRVPYCNRCGTWYRTVRNGKIDVPSAQRLAEICDIERSGDFRSPRFRLSRCQGGCGPTRCELSWEEPHVGMYLARVWLDDRQREQVQIVLDDLAEKDSDE